MSQDYIIRFVIKDDGTAALEHIGRAAKKTGDDVKGGVTRAKSGVEDLKSSLLKIGGALGGLYALKAAFTAIISTGASFETLKMQLKTITGSMEGAGRALDWITEFAATTPYQLEQVTKGFTRLKAYGLDPTDGTLRTIGDAVAAMGGSQEMFERTITAVGQIATKGKLSAEELRQLAENNIPVYQILQEKLGLTGEQVADIGNQGISASEGLRALMEGLEERFGGAMADQMKTLNGIWSNFGDTVTQALRSLAENGAMDAVKESLVEFTQLIQNAAKDGSLQQLGETFGTVMSAIATVVEWTTIKIPLYFKLAVDSVVKLMLEMVESIAGKMSILNHVVAGVFLSIGEDTMAEGLLNMNRVLTDMASGASITIAELDAKIEANLVTLGHLERDAPKAAAAVDQVKATYSGLGTAAGAAVEPSKSLHRAMTGFLSGLDVNKAQNFGATLQRHMTPALVAVSSSGGTATTSMTELGSAIAEVVDFRVGLVGALDDMGTAARGVDDSVSAAEAAWKQLNVTGDAAAAALSDYGFKATALKDAFSKLSLAGGDVRLSFADVERLAGTLGMTTDDLVRKLAAAEGGAGTLADIMRDKVGKELFDSEQYMASFKSGIADLFGESLQDLIKGDIDSLTDVVGSFFETMGQTLAQTLSASIVDGLFTHEGGLKGALKDMFSKENAGMNIVGGVGEMYSATQSSSRTGGTISGALGGFSAGAGLVAALSMSGPVGWAIMGIGAALGGVLGYMTSGSESPSTAASWSQGGGFDVYDSAGHQGLSQERRVQIERQMNALVDQYQTGYRSILESMRDPSLLGTGVGGAAGILVEGWDTDGKVPMDAQNLTRYFSDIVLPEMFEQAFADVFRRGFSNLGVTTEAFDALNATLANLPGPDRIKLLQQYVEVLVQSRDLLSDLGNIRENATETDWERFNRAFSETMAQAEIYTTGLEGMDFEQQLDQGVKSISLLAQWYDNAVNYLAALIQMQDQMQASIDAMRERITLRAIGEDPQDQALYALDKFRQWMQTLSTSTDVAGAQTAFNEAMRYLQMIESIGPEGNTIGSDRNLTRWLDDLEGVMQDVMGGFQGQVETQADQVAVLLEELRSVFTGTGEGLSGFDDTILDADAGLGELSGTVYETTGRMQSLQSATGDLEGAFRSLAAAAQGASTQGGGLTTENVAVIAAVVARRVLSEAAAA